MTMEAPEFNQDRSAEKRADYEDVRLLAASLQEWIDEIDSLLKVDGPLGGGEKRFWLKRIAEQAGVPYNAQAFPDDELHRIRNEFMLEVENLKKQF